MENQQIVVSRSDLAKLVLLWEQMARRKFVDAPAMDGFVSEKAAMENGAVIYYNCASSLRTCLENASPLAPLGPLPVKNKVQGYPKMYGDAAPNAIKSVKEWANSAEEAMSLALLVPSPAAAIAALSSVEAGLQQTQ